MSKQELEYKVLRWLEKNPNITQRQLAKELGVSLGKTHYLISSLIKVGWVKLDNFKRSDNKMGYMYLLTPKGANEKAKITKTFLVRKENEYQQLKHEIAQLKSEVQSL
ncbi:MarR family EPS-associated transcriptional regulator [Porticoccaceae bacterium]|jgi:MarR family transcriptional regulator, temperature-dependent positive regulator of motility|nr:MarR family EPS-associated transcriptional regulator [Porticoccaceae bacterium]MDA9014875.1 MarR family EPS-associated transcriptional regulator [Porticoccaceae bacterium]